MMGDNDVAAGYQSELQSTLPITSVGTGRYVVGVRSRERAAIDIENKSHLFVFEIDVGALYHHRSVNYFAASAGRKRRGQMRM